LSSPLFRCAGGEIVLPDPKLVLVDRRDGGNLVVNPPREVWERSELTPEELTQWSFLVAAAGHAMIDALPQLEGGCVNYWDAGNWALNDAAEPAGRKTAKAHRRVHLHLLGRSPLAESPSWRWGEAPGFPDFADRFAWTASFARLTPAECVAIVERVDSRLVSVYGSDRKLVAPWVVCAACGYPRPAADLDARGACAECRERA
jgi:hypothetical protein